jgi:hypothetical protein
MNTLRKEKKTLDYTYTYKYYSMRKEYVFDISISSLLIQMASAHILFSSNRAQLLTCVYSH